MNANYEDYGLPFRGFWTNLARTHLYSSRYILVTAWTGLPFVFALHWTHVISHPPIYI